MWVGCQDAAANSGLKSSRSLPNTNLQPDKSLDYAVPQGLLSRGPSVDKSWDLGFCRRGLHVLPRVHQWTPAR